MGTDEFRDVIPEDQYKRERYVSATMFFLLGGITLRHVIGKWRDLNDLEETWKKIISDPERLQDIHRHPASYRDDFKKWIAVNHPNLLL
ncbi:MAG TPA: hypothetical protein VF492_09925 [Verrucomicrobiae bacterium]